LLGATFVQVLQAACLGIGMALLTSALEWRRHRRAAWRSGVGHGLALGGDLGTGNAAGEPGARGRGWWDAGHGAASGHAALWVGIGGRGGQGGSDGRTRDGRDGDGHPGRGQHHALPSGYCARC
jgi:hypothetical protein